MKPVLEVLKGVVTLMFFALSTVLCCLAIYFLALIRLITPVRQARAALTGSMDEVVTGWVFSNAVLIRMLRVIEIKTTVEGSLDDRSNWWIVTSNHQSWSDVILIQVVLRQMAPPIKFFTKKELIWVPFVGFAMWLLRFPYVQRHSPAVPRGHSNVFEENKRNLSRAAAQFLQRPISVLSFLEGTRFTKAKQQKQESPFRHLLMPRTGGLLFAMDALQSKTSQIVDLTLNYEGAVPGFWDLLCGRCESVNVIIKPVAITEHSRANPKDFAYALWKQKDDRLDDLRSNA